MPIHATKKASAEKVIRANAFVLEDEYGNLIAALAVDSPKVALPKRAKIQFLLEEAFIQYQNVRFEFVNPEDPRCPRLILDSKRRAIDACMDYIRFYGRIELDEYVAPLPCDKVRRDSLRFLRSSLRA